LLLAVLSTAGFLTERSKRAALDELAPFAEFNIWQRFGLANFPAEPFDLFAYPADVAFHAFPDDPAGIGELLWSLHGLRSVRIGMIEEPLPRPLLVGAKTSRINVLDLDSARLDEGTLASVSGAPELEILILTGSSLRNFPPLVLPKLRELWLGQSQITDQGMEHVFNLTSLETLEFSGSGVSRIDPHSASRLLKLVLLSLGDTQVTQENVDELQKVMPNTQISF
jgi:Leucine-rich repeat (LRR) protein